MRRLHQPVAAMANNNTSAAGECLQCKQALSASGVSQSAGHSFCIGCSPSCKQLHGKSAYAKYKGANHHTSFSCQSQDPGPEQLSPLVQNPETVQQDLGDWPSLDFIPSDSASWPVPALALLHE